MSTNKHLGFEEVESFKDKYLFKADFNFLQRLADNVDDPIKISDRLPLGADPDLVRDILIQSFVSKNGKEINEIKEEIESLITAHGLQECWRLAYILLSHGMIGQEKKLLLLKLEQSRLAKIITEPFLLENSRNRALLWAYHLVISVVYVCVSFSLSVMFGS